MGNEPDLRQIILMFFVLFSMCSADFTYGNGSTIRSCYGVSNKNFHETICLFAVFCLFKISWKHDRRHPSLVNLHAFHTSYYTNQLWENVSEFYNRLCHVRRNQLRPGHLGIITVFRFSWNINSLNSKCFLHHIIYIAIPIFL